MTHWSVWVVVDTYYKHGEYGLHVFNDDESLKNFILNHIQYRGKKRRQGLASLSLDELIKEAVDYGNSQIDKQLDWGIRTIRKVVPETNDTVESAPDPSDGSDSDSDDSDSEPSEPSAVTEPPQRVRKLTAYNVFIKDKLNELRNAENMPRMAELGAIWRGMSEEERDVYHEKAKQLNKS